MLYYNKMPKRLGRHMIILKKIVHSDKKTISEILKSSKNDFIKCINDCCFNILNGNISLNKTEQIKLKKFKKIIRKIVANKKNFKKQKKIITTQTGGFLPLLITPVLTLISELLLEQITNG